MAIDSQWISGEGAPADDALETGWFTPTELAAADTAASSVVAALAHLALARM